MASDPKHRDFINLTVFLPSNQDCVVSWEGRNHCKSGQGNPMTVRYYKSQLPKCWLSLDPHCGPFTPTLRNAGDCFITDGFSGQQHGGQSSQQTVQGQVFQPFTFDLLPLPSTHITLGSWHSRDKRAYPPFLVWLSRMRKAPPGFPGRSRSSSAFSRLRPSYSHLGEQQRGGQGQPGIVG